MATAIAMPANAQQPPHAAASGTEAVGAAEAGRTRGSLSFDVASVRPQDAGRRYFNDGGGFLNPSSNAAPPKGGLFSWNVPVAYLIYFAYDLRSGPLRRDLWQHLPDWRQQMYTIEARADGEPSRDDVRQMARSLLEERFKLAVHRGTREGQVNALTVVRTEVGLKPHAPGAPCEVAPPATAWAYPPYKDVPVHCGIFDRQLGKYTRRIEMVDVTVAQIVDALSNHSPVPVLDSTGLTGKYDAFLDYGPETVPADADPAAEVGVPVAAAVEKQLGLKLVKRNATVEYFVVDHIEKPSEN